MIASVARRYARALLSLGLDEDRHEKFGEELELVVAAIEQSRDVGAFFRSPGFTAQHRHAAVGALAKVLKLSPTLVSFLQLLVDRQRIIDLPQISRVYGTLLDAQIGRVRATVTSAEPMSARDTEKLRKVLEELTGRDTVLDARTDASIIGGLVTQVGATRFDGSLRTQLERMRDALKGEPV